MTTTTTRPDLSREAIEVATSPEDLFGAEPLDEATLKRMYRSAAFIAHPDGDGGSDELMAKLTKLYERGLVLVQTGLWGRSVNVGARIAKGDICNIYLTSNDNVLKVPRSPARSNLVLNEARILQKLRADGPESFHMYAPELIRSYRRKDPRTKAVRQVNVLEYFSGFYTLAEVKAAYPDGIGGRDMAWMWRRILVALTLARDAGVVHGAVTPDHIIIHPTLHGVVLLDWTLAGSEGAKRTFKIPRWESIYPEDSDKLSFESDVYMASMSMAYVCHPAQTPQAVHTHLRGCRVASLPHPWKLKQEFDDLLDELYGKRRYRPFKMPASA